MNSDLEILLEKYAILARDCGHSEDSDDVATASRDAARLLSVRIAMIPLLTAHQLKCLNQLETALKVQGYQQYEGTASDYARASQLVEAELKLFKASNPKLPNAIHSLDL